MLEREKGTGENSGPGFKKKKKKKHPAKKKVARMKWNLGKGCFSVWCSLYSFPSLFRDLALTKKVD